VREQLALVDSYGPRIRDPGRDSPPVEPPIPQSVPTAGATVPDPFDDADALEELEERITTLAAHIHAATHRLLTLIADFDRRRGWELGGHRSCAHWLSFCTGIDLGTAREKVRTARALVGLPETSASMGRGELSFSKVRALTRVATGTNEEELLTFARGSTTAQVERMVRGVKRGSREDEAALERERYESRSFSVFPDGDGMYVVKGRLPAELGVLLMRAIDAASDALYRERPESTQGQGQGARAEARAGAGAGAGAGAKAGTGAGAGARVSGEAREPSQRAGAQRRADALVLLAERALAAGFGGKGDKVAADDGENEIDEIGEPDETDPAAEAPEPPISGTRAERYQVMLHVEAETLKADGEGGRSELDDGTRVSAEPSGLLGGCAERTE
jgi:hypothetical protein